MGQRTEITARSDGTFQRNERNDSAIDHRLDDLDHRAPHAGMPLQKRIQPRHQRRPHHLGIEISAVAADADRMRQQNIALELFEVVRRCWSLPAAVVAIAATALPPRFWRLTDDFLVEPVLRICFLLLFACAIALGRRKSSALAFAMLGYGMDKVFALQFNWSMPGPGRLAEPGDARHAHTGMKPTTASNTAKCLRISQ